MLGLHVERPKGDADVDRQPQIQATLGTDDAGEVTKADGCGEADELDNEDCFDQRVRGKAELDAEVRRHRRHRADRIDVEPITEQEHPDRLIAGDAADGGGEVLPAHTLRLRGALPHLDEQGQ